MSSPGQAEPAPPAGAIVAVVPAPVAQAVSVASTPQSSALAPTPCANCGALLTGKYCSACGQRHLERPVHHFWHFVSEATEDLTHADSRLWQTLSALLFRPGFLTREFLEGRRARYLPPVRLYLVVSVIFFIIAGLHSQVSGPGAVVITENGKNFHYEVIPAGEAAGAAAVGQMPAGARGGAETALAAIAPTPAARQRICEQTGTFIGQHAGWLAFLGPRATRNCLAVARSGGVERLNEAITHNLERAMFLFLPLLALAMKPLYLKPPRHYVEHLLFFLHNHAFVFVMLGLKAVLEMSTSSALVLGPIKAAIAIYILIYFYRAMRRVYGQGRWLTLTKLAALGIAYFFLGILIFTATLSYSFLTL